MNAAFAKKGGPKRMAFLIQVQEMQWVGAIWHKTCAKKWNSITPPSVTHFWHLTYLGILRDHSSITLVKGLGGWGQKNGNFY